MNKMNSALDFIRLKDQLLIKECDWHTLNNAFIPFSLFAKYKINVWRNHNFETMQIALIKFAAISNWQADFKISDYDDTLMFSDWQAADIEIIWYDGINIFSDKEKIEWFFSRILSLRSKSFSPILILTWDIDEIILQTALNESLNIHYCDLKSLCELNDVALLDLRLKKITGTCLSKKSQIVIAKELACKFIPACISPPIKALAVDLDNTLYGGVLGESNIEGIQITAGHIELQKLLLEYRAKGIFLALISKNIESDVRKFFIDRNELEIRFEDFSAYSISWDDKAKGLQKISHELRIGLDSILYIDDNMGELVNIAMQLPLIHLVHAKENGYKTCDLINYYPGLWRFKVNSYNDNRINDFEKIKIRNNIETQAIDIDTYFASLEIIIDFFYNQKKHISRIAELSQKTNQFNFSFHRYNEARIFSFFQDPNYNIVSINLKDKLSDSGLIGILVINFRQNCLYVEELCVSCRALGRKLESFIVSYAIMNSIYFETATKIYIGIKYGSRNEPALSWLKRLCALSQIPPEGYFEIDKMFIKNVVAETKNINTNVSKL